MIGMGSLVVPNYDFARERTLYRYDYPTMDKILTVNKVQFDELENQMLWFDELKIPIPLAAICFDEVQDEAEGDCILNEAFKIANNL
jgi:hypothetical protein